MPKPFRTRAVTAAQVRSYAGKAQEFADAAANEFSSGRYIAATSLAIHAAINAADAVCGARLGQRAAGDDHSKVLALLAQAGPDGDEVQRDLRRLLPLKTTTEYEPDDVSQSTALKATERAARCAQAAWRVANTLP
jgi:HEPN domain-containing protein